MFNTFTKSVLTLLVVLAGASVLYSQVPEHELPAIRERAMSNFNAGSYDAAETDFTTLIRQFPGDPLYRYYAGICKVELNRDLEEAAELLYFASTRGVPPDVYYYLGEASRTMYDFEKAKRYYEEFSRSAPRRMSREKNAGLLIRSLTAAMQITASYNPFDVKNVTFIDFNDPDQYEQIRMKGGILTEKPEVFFGAEENRSGLSRLMFMPEKPVRGQIVYFSGMERTGKNGLQVMQARRNSAGHWVDIQPVDALNTEFDEILPYFDPVGRDIYFASNGREGVGGFDLYHSHFDEDRKEWSEPVNLGFPVNSVSNDYLLLPGSDLGKVIFFSSRQSSDTVIAAYSVHLSEPKQSLEKHTPSEIRRIANLGNVAVDAREDYEAYQSLLADDGKMQAETEITAGEPVEEKQQANRVELEMDVGADPAYQELIAGALLHQSASDSLVELALDARLKVRNSEDPNDRWMYQKQIMVWEKRAAEEKEAADSYFDRLTEYAPKEADPAKTVIPSAIEKDTVIEDLTIYRFAQTGTVEEKVKEVSDQNESVAIPRGTVYKIQLGVFSKRVDENVFGGLKPITEERLEDRNLYRYFFGDFTRYEEVRDALPVARAAGFADAFIVASYNGNIMSVEKAKKLEKPVP